MLEKDKGRSASPAEAALAAAVAAARARSGAGDAPVAASWAAWEGPLRGAAARPKCARASMRGSELVYPASIAKLFLLAAAHLAFAEGRLRPTPELERALSDMITVSSDDATHLVVDALTGTTGGLELPNAEMTDWLERRQAINRSLARFGWPELAGVTVAHKVYAEGPYGREKVARGASGEHGNRLTTDATARLIEAIVAGEAVSPARSAAMLALMARDPSSRNDDPQDQVRGFFGEGLPDCAQLWSKAGWTSKTRHDAAYVELPEGPSFVLVAFTTGPDMASNMRFLPELARGICTAGLGL